MTGLCVLLAQKPIRVCVLLRSGKQRQNCKQCLEKSQNCYVVYCASHHHCTHRINTFSPSSYSDLGLGMRFHARVLHI